MVAVDQTAAVATTTSANGTNGGAAAAAVVAGHYYTGTTNVALGGAWHAQEVARKRSLKLAAGAEARAAAHAAENGRMAAEVEAMRQKVRVAMQLLGESKETEGERERAGIGRTASALPCPVGVLNRNSTPHISLSPPPRWPPSHPNDRRSKLVS